MAYRKITDIKDTIGMRAVFYARVSTAEEEQLNAIELQIEENRGCIKDHGWKLVGEYIDRSKSGTMVKGRDDYQRLYEDLYEDLFDIVVIKDQERLQRNTLDWYLFINRVVQTGKLLFMYMDGKFYSPDDALITGVRAIIAEEFSRNLSKKLHNYHDHRIEKARQGQEIALQGSGNVYGWDKKDGKYYINPEQAKVRRLMCEGIMARKGSTLIAKELNDAGYRNTVGKPWKPMDIPKFVYDCKNVGTMIINKERHDFESKQTIKLPKEEWVYVENALPPIVTQEEWDLICKIHEERVIATGSDRRGKKTSGYSFSGKLVCGICGAPYWRKQRVSKDEYWVCSTKQTKGRRTRKRDSTMGKAGEINPLGCDNENISYNSLMEIMGVVSERLQANTDTIKQDMINWLTKLRKQLLEANGGHTEADLQREISRKSKLLDAYLDGILNKQEYQKKAEELDERIIQLKAETEKNKANSGDIAEIDKVLANIDEEVARYIDGNEKLKVEYLLEHLEQVQIFPDKVIVIVPILSEGIVVEKTQYVSREKICDYSFSPPDRRFQDSPFFLPDFNEMGKNDNVSDILFFIDTSGSISDNDMTAAYSEIKGAIDQYDGKLQGWLGFFDAAIIEPKPFSSFEEFNVIKPAGGGGTDFQIIFEYVNQHMKEKEPNCIIILTDGYAPFPKEELANDIPVLWLINNQDVTPPWGKVARFTVRA